MAKQQLNEKNVKPIVKRLNKDKRKEIQLAALGQHGQPDSSSKEGVYINSDYYRNDVTGKPYPGRVNFNTQRVMAYNSTVVRAILTLRSHQIAKLPIKIMASNSDEPPRQMSIFDYNIYQVENHPAFDDSEKIFLTKIYYRLDPDAYIANKKKAYDDADKGDFSDAERITLKHLQEKHDDFYRKRAKDKQKILGILNEPDPWFTDTRSWERLCKSILMDMLVIDRGAIIKLRDSSGNLRGLMPVDGASLRPVINKFGTFEDDYAYVQVIHGSPHVYLRKEDVIILMMNPMTDLKYFGYGLSNMESLYTAVLSDIFIDKGNLDFYRKGGSIPEGFISVEPPSSREGMVQQIDQEQLETIQRHLQAIMMGDYTQVPIVSGGKISWIDFKGKRRDMQFKELAEYLTRKICAVYQVSPQDVGVISDVNRANAVVQSEMTKSKGLKTLMSVISEYITTYVIKEIRPEGDLKLWFEDDDLERRKNEWTMNQQQLVSGAITINQWRASQGMHPVPWGNTPLQGLRNWKPEEEEEGGMGGAPPGLPPLPGGLLDNPGGPVGGDNPMAGQPPQGAPTVPPVGSAMKSAKYFELNEERTPNGDDLMVKHFSDMYVDTAKFYELWDYPGGENVRKAVDSYEYFTMSHPVLGVQLTKSEGSYDPADPFVFSRYLGNSMVEVTDEEGDVPVFKSLAMAVYDALTEDKLENVRLAINSDDEEDIRDAIEWAVFKSLDTSVQTDLYEVFYKFQSQPHSDATIERVGEVLEL